MREEVFAVVLHRSDLVVAAGLSRSEAWAVVAQGGGVDVCRVSRQEGLHDWQWGSMEEIGLSEPKTWVPSTRAIAQTLVERTGGDWAKAARVADAAREAAEAAGDWRGALKMLDVERFIGTGLAARLECGLAIN